MDPLFLLPSVIARDPRVDAWFAAPDHELRRMVQPWFERLRAYGPDVTETMADGHPVACVADAACAYVDAFSAHAAIGFFCGAVLDHPAALLEGGGKRMLHVKSVANRGETDRVHLVLDAVVEDGLARLIVPENPPAEAARPPFTQG